MIASPTAEAISISALLAQVARRDRGRILSGLIARLGDFQLAEDALQDAILAAAQTWPGGTVPAKPMNWLMQVAYRKALDRIRQRKIEQRSKDDIAVLSGEEAYEEETQEIGDERLRLIFTCCHPALDQKSQVALTLRTLGGLSTPEIATAFLDQDATMGQRLSRAKAKIAAAKIPFRVPTQDEWPARLQAVLTVIYLIYNAGYSAGPLKGADLAGEAIYLARTLSELRPNEAEIEGCLALLLITHARRYARVDQNGVSLPMSRQDRSLWRSDEIVQGLAIIDRAVLRRSPGPYQIKAAIAACHVLGPHSDWPQISALYERLLDFEPTAIVRLNAAVALAEAGDVQEGLARLAPLQSELRSYQPYYAALADLLAKQGQMDEAKAAYLQAINLARSSADAAFLTDRKDQLN